MWWEESPSILAHPEVFDENHVPPEMHARDAQMREIGLCVRPITQGQKPMNCWLYGNPGVGKTATARWILRKLESEAGVTSVYVNCWENPTFFSVLEYVARRLRMLGADKLSTSFKLERLKQHVSREKMLVVLDEIDQPVPKERNAILYNLGRMPCVGLVCACNSQYVYLGLEERVKSRLNPARILFEEYSREELTAILRERAEYGLNPGAWDDSLLVTITRLARGDARIAIQTLKNAAYLAERDSREKVTDADARRAWNSAKELKKTYLLRKLTDHHRLLYELVSKRPGILSGDLWRAYRKTCADRHVKPIAIRTYSEYCNKLAELGLIEAKRAAIQGKVREFKVAE